MPTRALAVLGRGLLPVDTPVARADDAGLARGDGVFETLHIRGGEAWQLGPHLARMARSAAILHLDLPSADELAGLIRLVVDAAPGEGEYGVKIVATRGPDTGQAEPPTVFATVIDVTPAQRTQRRTGVKVATVSLGVPVDARAETPWLLGGAKTLSYGVNMAMLRYAAAQGADDALVLSSDGFVLEAPTATVVWAADGALRTIPLDTGILAGTTVEFLLDRADELGLRPERCRAVVDDLYAADEAWLCSSVRGAARITHIDGEPLNEKGFTQGVQGLLGFPD